MGSQPPAVGSSVNRDAGFKTLTVASIVPIVGNNTTEGTGVGVDLKGYEGAKINIQIGTSLDTLSTDVYITPSVQDSPDNSAWTALDTNQYRVDVGALSAIDNSAEDAVLISVTVLPRPGAAKINRYIRPLLTFTGTHTNGTPIAATVEKCFPRIAPAT